jgi:hypothetical protein
LLLLFAFVTSYMLALGGLLGAAGRWRAALLALGLAIGFAAKTDPWVHGALLVAFVVAALGLFVMCTWLLARWLGPHERPAVPVVSTEAMASTPPTPSRVDKPAVPPAELAPRRARAPR